MSEEELPIAHPVSNRHDRSLLPAEDFSKEPYAARQSAVAEEETKSNHLFANHKGKLAVGAAAMLGIAIFYKWRENRLAQDDPEEYERFRRIKEVVESDGAQLAEKE